MAAEPGHAFIQLGLSGANRALLSQTLNYNPKTRLLCILGQRRQRQPSVAAPTHFLLDLCQGFDRNAH